ncbi:hypothetical protein DRF75_01170 [Ehrlichia minasensis]|uniref:Uncharacterized protein n=2 Tax=Ehrlichia minasensis TaxID=1242993 RepID=A0A4Q6I508_9RICK|nr:hypothetical protein DRF75_01170 [Ehrlichia minasensis]CEI84800.1 Ankyrin repeat family protein [Ehrlichia minasensis]
MLNNGTSILQDESDEVIDDEQLGLSGNNNVNDTKLVLSESDIAKLSQVRTQGIPPDRLLAINSLLTDASLANNFSSVFNELLSFLRCRKKKKIKQDLQFIVFQDEKGRYSIVNSIESIHSNYALENQVLQGHVYICDICSLALVFPDGSVEREAFLSLVFNSTFSKKGTEISTLRVRCFSKDVIEYTDVSLNGESLWYALEHEDVLAVKVMSRVLNRLEKRNSILEKAIKSALLQVIQQRNNVSDNFLECVNHILEAKVEDFDLDAKENKNIAQMFKDFTRVVCDEESLLSRICKAAHENIIKTVCVVELERIKKAKAECAKTDLPEVQHSDVQDMQLVNMRYGTDNDNILCVLVRSDSISLLKLLFEKYKLDINAVNAYGYTVLHFAALYNAKKCAKFLLESDSKIFHQPSKSQLTPFHLAASTNSVEVLQLLAKHKPGAIYDRDSMGRNIMHHAAIGGALDTILCCLTLGVDVNAQATIYDSDGEIDEVVNTGRSCTALHFAIEEGKLDVVSCLLSCSDIDLSIKNSEGHTPITTVDRNGNNLLHQCVVSNKVGLLTKALLLGWQHIVSEKNNAGQTAFDLAIANGRVMCAVLLLQLLCEQLKCKGNEWKKIFESSDSNGNTLLHQAIASRNITLVKKILSFRDIKLMHANKDNETPLDVAIKTGNAEVISLLIKDSRQNLIFDNDNSYVIKLMHRGLITKEVYQIIKNRCLKKERCSYAKLGVSLILTFVLITCIAIFCILKYNKELQNAFGIGGNTQIFFIAITVFLLAIICMGCCLLGMYHIKLTEHEKLLRLEISDTRFFTSDNNSVSSASVSSGYVGTNISDKILSSASSTEGSGDKKMQDVMIDVNQDVINKTSERSQMRSNTSQRRHSIAAKRPDRLIHTQVSPSVKSVEQCANGTTLASLH